MTGLGIVLVNYRSEALVSAVADCYLAAGFEVVVVDNSSSYRGAGRTITSPGNVGFGAACNAGVAALPGLVDVLALHNPDVRPDAAALTELWGEVHDHGLDVVAPRLAVDHTVRARGFAYPSVPREIFVSWRYQRLRRGTAIGHEGSAPEGTEPRVKHGRMGRRFGSGALLVLRRGAYTAVGGFDEDYFLYAEDLDLWHRMHRAGYRLGFSDAVTMRHDNATAAADVRSVEREALRRLGVELFAAKHRTSWRPYRWVHRTLRLGPPGVPLVDRIDELSRAGDHPERMMDEIRPGLVSGRFLRAD